MFKGRPRKINRLEPNDILGNGKVLGIHSYGSSLRDTVYDITHLCCGAPGRSAHGRLLERERDKVTKCYACKRKEQTQRSIQKLIDKTIQGFGGVRVLEMYSENCNAENCRVKVIYKCCEKEGLMSCRTLRARITTNTQDCSLCATEKQSETKRKKKPAIPKVVPIYGITQVPWKPAESEIGKRWIWGERQSLVPLSAIEAQRRIVECMKHYKPLPA
jgi:hypothetical protein